MSTQKHAFQAEVAQLLHLVTHSLYSNKEIFLRELISNASDACDKLRYEALNNAALFEDTPTLEIRVAFDKAAKTLTISDNGIGMSEQEAIDHLGTIAKSGTRDFMSKLSGDQQSDAKDQGSLIGQFGVGFYSGFIVADKIVVETRRVLSMLEDLAKHDAPAADASEEDKKDAGKFTQFYTDFGAVLKEGLGEDFANKDKIAKLLRFASSTTDTVSVGFADYKARMKEGQEAIFYITADSLAAAKNSPQLEVFRKKGIEVLLMSDRVDEWALGFLNEFDGTPLQSVAKGAFDLGKLQDEEEKKAAEEAAETFKPLLAKLKEALKDKAEDVRVTSRLDDSPACLVVKDDGMSLQLARMLKQAGQSAPESKPILEVNPEHPLVKKLDTPEGNIHFHDLAHIVFDQALLAEGGMPEDPAAYVKRVNALLV